MRPYFIASLILTGVSELVLFLLFNRLLIINIHPVIYFFPAYFFSTFLLVHWQLLAALKKDPKRFVTIFMGATGGKMIISIFMILIISLIIGEGFKPAAVVFIALYLLFMVLEVVFILRDLKNSTQPRN